VELTVSEVRKLLCADWSCSGDLRREKKCSAGRYGVVTIRP
jgi:hypothetical protein